MHLLHYASPRHVSHVSLFKWESGKYYMQCNACWIHLAFLSLHCGFLMEWKTTKNKIFVLLKFLNPEEFMRRLVWKLFTHSFCKSKIFIFISVFVFWIGNAFLWSKIKFVLKNIHWETCLYLLSFLSAPSTVLQPWKSQVASVCWE